MANKYYIKLAAATTILTIYYYYYNHYYDYCVAPTLIIWISYSLGKHFLSRSNIYSILCF